MTRKFKNRISEIDVLKREIDEYRPLSQHALHELKEYYRIGLTYSSNAIEGNSLSEVETKIVLEEGITIGGKPLKEHLEALGHSEAYEHIYKLAGTKQILEQDILRLHYLLYFRIDPDNAGKYRSKQVFITGTKYIPPKPGDLAVKIDKLVNQISRIRQENHPVEFAALLHKEFVGIHPFIDGNGRCARLLMNLALMQHDYVITIIPPVMRTEYIELVRDAQLNPDKCRPFINFISQMIYESHKEYLRLLESL